MGTSIDTGSPDPEDDSTSFLNLNRQPKELTIFTSEEYYRYLPNFLDVHSSPLF